MKRCVGNECKGSKSECAENTVSHTLRVTRICSLSVWGEGGKGGHYGGTDWSLRRYVSVSADSFHREKERRDDVDHSTKLRGLMSR